MENARVIAPMDARRWDITPTETPSLDFSIWTPKGRASTAAVNYTMKRKIIDFIFIIWKFCE